MAICSSKRKYKTFNGWIGLIQICGILMGIGANSREYGIVSPYVISMIQIMEFLFVQKNSIIVIAICIYILYLVGYYCTFKGIK